MFLSDRVEVDVVGEDGTTRKELHLLGLGILGSMQGFEALHALTKVCSWKRQQSHLFTLFWFCYFLFSALLKLFFMGELVRGNSYSSMRYCSGSTLTCLCHVPCGMCVLTSGGFLKLPMEYVLCAASAPQRRIVSKVR